LNYSRFIYLLFLLLISCSGNFERVSKDQFVGKWELHGRSMFEGIIIKIDKKDDGTLQGKIERLNDNQYVKMFAKEGDIWISDIARSSNFRFKITEKKLAKELFGLYGMSSSVEFNAEFITPDKIGISRTNKPAESSIYYNRVK